jgi:hypothetical protein
MNEPTVHTVRYGTVRYASCYVRTYLCKAKLFFPVHQRAGISIGFFILNLTCNFATDAVFTY